MRSTTFYEDGSVEVHDQPGLGIVLNQESGAFEAVSKCSCAHNRDGSTTSMLCSLHADTDPCLTMARVTGKRRKGTIRRGRCTACGWMEGER